MSIQCFSFHFVPYCSTPPHIASSALDQLPLTDNPFPEACIKFLQTASVHKLLQMSNITRSPLGASRVCIRSSISDCSFRRAIPLPQQDAGNLFLVYTRTIVLFQANLGLREWVSLRGASLEYLDSSCNGTSTDATSSEENTIFDALYQEDCNDELYFHIFDAFVKYRALRNADCASHNGFAKNSQSFGIVEGQKCLDVSNSGDEHEKQQKDLFV